MKISKFLPVLFCLFWALPTAAATGNGMAGDFSQAFSPDKIPTDLTLSVNGTAYPFSPSDLLSLIDETAKLSPNQKYRSEIENPDFCLYKKSLTCHLVFPYDLYGHLQKAYTRALDENNLQTFLQNLAAKTDTAAVDAKLQMADGKVSTFSLSSPGVQLDMDQSAQILTDYINRGDFSVTLTLPVKKTDPIVSTDSIENLGINTLVGEGVSDFRGSPVNRIFNIKRALQQFNGVLIKPGEEFSFIQNLGDVDAQHGYRPELSIVGNATELQFGGGICQVSTTAFRAAIYSGLKITARTPHAYPVGYYNPQGMDSTVYIPRPDLRFINNTPGYILVENRIEGTKLFFDFYGTSDGRKTNVIGPKILEHNPDGSMKATFTQEVYDKDGKLIQNDIFNSAYNSPSHYPHPDSTGAASPLITEKPQKWSQNEWDIYKKAHGL